MLIDYAMVFSPHAEKRLVERYNNVTVEDLLITELVPISDESLKSYLETCKPRSRKQVEMGYREILEFKGMGIEAVMDKAEFKVVTIFPTADRSFVPFNRDKRVTLDALRNKIKQIEPLSRRTTAIGHEMARCQREMSRLKSEIKDENLAAINAKEESEYKKLKDFVKREFGESKLREFFDSI
jgi:hypothetical protein